MYVSARISGEQVYLGYHMQGQGLLTDMISLARGKGPHYPEMVWSKLMFEQPRMTVSEPGRSVLNHEIKPNEGEAWWN